MWSSFFFIFLKSITITFGSLAIKVHFFWGGGVALVHWCTIGVWVFLPAYCAIAVSTSRSLSWVSPAIDFHLQSKVVDIRLRKEFTDPSTVMSCLVVIYKSCLKCLSKCNNDVAVRVFHIMNNDWGDRIRQECNNLEGFLKKKLHYCGGRQRCQPALAFYTREWARTNCRFSNTFFPPNGKRSIRLYLTLFLQD